MLLDPAVIEDPYPFYRLLQRDAPVWQVPDTELFVVSSYALIAEASSRVEDFSSTMRCLFYRGDDGLPQRLSFGDLATPTLATADPPLHAVHRTTVFPELVAKRMATLEPEIIAITHACLDRAFDTPTIDFMSVVGNIVPMAIVSGLIGFRESNQATLLQAAFDSTALLGSTLSLARLTELVGTIGAIESWITEQLERATAEDARDDILGAIARGVARGSLSVAEGTIILHTLLSAGGESTSSLLGNAVRMIAEQPELQARLREDLSLVPAFVEEALRLESPFRFMMRSVPDTTSLGGVTIAAGSNVLLLWGAANRDPHEFDQPDEVMLHRRALRHHVAFGRGIHHCIGAPLARLEGHAVVQTLLDRTSIITLDPTQPPTWVDSLLVRRHQRLPVRLVAN
jgi:cytochrome P450 family 144